MSIEIGVGIGPCFGAGDGGAAAFSPADGFLLSEKGLWYNPNDLTTLFQDSAATTPVTTVDQIVRRMNDKSGNGINYVAPSDAASSLLKQAPNGNYFLKWDDVDDVMNMSAALDLTGKTGYTRVVGLTLPVGVDVSDVITATVPIPSTSNSGGSEMSLVSVGAQQALQVNIAGPTAVRSVRTVAYSFPQTWVIGNVVDLTQTGHGQLQLRLNGVDARDTWVTDADTGAATLTSQNYNLGARAAGSRHGNMEFYGLIMREGADQTFLENCEAWMAGF